MFIFLIFFCSSIVAQTSMVFIEGFVFDNKTNERLAGVFLSLADSGIAVTDVNGYYSFNIVNGVYDISADMLGYTKVIKTLTTDSTEIKTKLFFRLAPELIKIKQVTVTGEQYKETVKYKTFELKQGDLRNIPQVGEPDVLRAIQVLPGVTSLNDFSAQLFVRGGNFDETLIALDDVPVYNPYHLGGFFSMFNTDIVNSVTLYPSNYPGKYGGYLSGALNIRTKSGNREKIKGSASIGLISSKGFVEIPISKGSLVLAARRTYLDILASPFVKDDMPYYFYDIYSKYTYAINEKSFISLSGFHSRDIFEIYKEDRYFKSKVKTEPTWGNAIYDFNYSYLFSDNNSIDIKFYYSSTSMRALGESSIDDYNDIETNLYLNNEIQDITGLLKYNHSTMGHNFQVGIEYKQMEIKNEWDIGVSELSDFGFDLQDTFFDFSPNSYSDLTKSFFLNYFLSDKLQFSKKFSIFLGIRGSYFSKLKRNLISPLVNINYNINNNTDVVFRYGRYYQNLYVIKDQSVVFLDPFSIYFFPKSNAQLPFTDNYEVSVILPNTYYGLNLEISSYYKKRRNLSSTYTQSNNPYKYEDGYSIGLDLLLKKDLGNLNGWLSYSLARSSKSNYNYDYVVRSDRTHTIKLLLNISLSESWHLTSYWTYATGVPYTRVIGAYLRGEEIDFEEKNYYEDEYRYWYPIDGKKNSVRTSDYHKLDIGLTGSFIWGSFYVKPYLQILNIYNSPNPVFENKYFNIGTKQTKRASYITPTFGLTIEF